MCVCVCVCVYAHVRVHNLRYPAGNVHVPYLKNNMIVGNKLHFDFLHIPHCKKNSLRYYHKCTLDVM